MRCQTGFLLIALSCWWISPARAQSNDPAPHRRDFVVDTAAEWGGQGGVYTCQQWRAYVTRMYRIGDPRRRGYIDAAGFELIRKASPVFENASFDYFDVENKGRVSQKDFIEFESPFFARFDRNHTCHITMNDVRAASETKAAPQQPAERSGGGRGGGMMGGGMGGGGFGGR
ncbi:EF-hand domain-containing protein [Methylocystis heyeri]|uniref:EF-hand domain-containing protein n=1 Tax=Methylocystis heyeri TaxID=391905 RepID=A0A6B8KLN3_9HYPH|nr:EF-hand domain-containing protein [Methylocystis heyeri]QGM47820.1 EF-hand domain-containing protein [Methylocystis heyeri]